MFDVMKFRYILILLSVLLLGACAEDKGNYVYHEINEVAIAEGLEQGKLYTKVSFVDNLTFDPVINSTLKDSMKLIMSTNGKQYLEVQILKT